MRKYLKEIQRLPAQHSGATAVKETSVEAPRSKTSESNFNGAIFEALQEAGIGVMIRNSKGEVLAAFSKRIPMTSSVVILESFAARRAV